MVTSSNVPITDTERDRLRARRPGLLRWRARRAWESELEKSVCVEYAFRVQRVWDLTECSPGCCPNSYLVECGPDQFVVLKTWDESLDKREGRFPGTDVRLRILPHLQMVISVSFEGPEVSFSGPSLHEAHPGLSGTEVLVESTRDYRHMFSVFSRPDNNELKQTKPALAKMARSSLLNSMLSRPQGG